MRLWSLHPKYLDRKGLVACWREGLLARKVLLGETRGYRNHPQLDRFKVGDDPVALIDTYLRAVAAEADVRGYRFDRDKLGAVLASDTLDVTEGQMRYEFEHLRSKLSVRDPAYLLSFAETNTPIPHPLFRVIPGGVEAWERVDKTV